MSLSSFYFSRCWRSTLNFIGSWSWDFTSRNAHLQCDGCNLYSKTYATKMLIRQTPYYADMQRRSCADDACRRTIDDHSYPKTSTVHVEVYCYRRRIWTVRRRCDFKFDGFFLEISFPLDLFDVWKTHIVPTFYDCSRQMKKSIYVIMHLHLGNYLSNFFLKALAKVSVLYCNKWQKPDEEYLKGPLCQHARQTRCDKTRRSQKP